MKIIQIILLFAVCGGLFALTGCDGKTDLSGKVTYSDDGSPLTIGTICFEKDSFCARGRIGKDGTYVVGSTGLQDGIPPGKYAVYVAGANREISTEKFESLIDEKFATAATSGLTCEVPAPGNRFDFQVDRRPAKKK